MMVDMKQSVQNRLPQIDLGMARYLSQRDGKAAAEAEIIRLNEKIAILRQKMPRLSSAKASARKLAGILHRIWIDGSDF